LSARRSSSTRKTLPTGDILTGGHGRDRGRDAAALVSRARVGEGTSPTPSAPSAHRGAKRSVGRLGRSPRVRSWIGRGVPRRVGSGVRSTGHIAVSRAEGAGGTSTGAAVGWVLVLCSPRAWTFCRWQGRPLFPLPRVACGGHCLNPWRDVVVLTPPPGTRGFGIIACWRLAGALLGSSFAGSPVLLSDHSGARGGCGPGGDVIGPRVGQARAFAPW